MLSRQNKKGETLIEVIAALTCLVLAGLSAVTIILSVMTSTAVSKEYLLAQNLAREGVEGVINIRDTNWLLYPSEKTDCWLEFAQDTCDPGNPLTKAKTETHYILTRNENGRFKLVNKQSVDGLNLENLEKDSADNDLYELFVDSTYIYTHDPEAAMLSPQPVPTFYRMITFEEVTDQDFDTQAVQIHVRVQWFNKSDPKTYELKSVITNYEK